MRESSQDFLPLNHIRLFTAASALIHPARKIKGLMTKPAGVSEADKGRAKKKKKEGSPPGTTFAVSGVLPPAGAPPAKGLYLLPQNECAQFP